MRDVQIIVKVAWMLTLALGVAALVTVVRVLAVHY